MVKALLWLTALFTQDKNEGHIEQRVGLKPTYVGITPILLSHKFYSGGDSQFGAVVKTSGLKLGNGEF